MRLFKFYLKQNRIIIFMVLTFIIVYNLSFYLFHIPLQAVIYPSFLCCFISLIVITIKFFEFKRKHNKLTVIKDLTSAMIFNLPSIQNIDDIDYQNIINILKEGISELETSSALRYDDMVNYYTVWVHQIKTPIASMRLTLQNDDSQLSRIITADLFRIEQYVEMVLAFLRLNSDTNDYVFKQYNIDDILRKSIKKFSLDFINKKIKLDYIPCNCTIITDEKWFSFVIEQILSNGLKYTQKGFIKIYMKNSYTVCIEDSGIGILPEDLPRIFEKGYTGYNGRNETHSSGIGLYLCKKICDNLGIGIKAVSKIDKGTVIQLNLEQYKIKKE